MTMQSHSRCGRKYEAGWHLAKTSRPMKSQFWTKAWWAIVGDRIRGGFPEESWHTCGGGGGGCAEDTFKCCTIMMREPHWETHLRFPSLSMEVCKHFANLQIYLSNVNCWVSAEKCQYNLFVGGKWNEIESVLYVICGLKSTTVSMKLSEWEVLVIISPIFLEY